MTAAAVREAVSAAQAINRQVNARYQSNFDWYRDNAARMTPQGRAVVSNALNTQASILQTINTGTYSLEQRARESGYLNGATLGDPITISVSAGVITVVSLLVGAGLVYAWYKFRDQDIILQQSRNDSTLFQAAASCLLTGKCTPEQAKQLATAGETASRVLQNIPLPLLIFGVTVGGIGLVLALRD